MADIIIQERQNVVAHLGRSTARVQREKGFCDVLVKILKVATPFFISLAAFALLPPELAIIVTVVVAVATLAYLFRNVGSGIPRPSGYHTQRTIHHHHYNGANNKHGGSMSGVFATGLGRKVEEGKAANPSRTPSGVGAAQSSIGKAGFGASGSSNSSSSAASGKAGFGATSSSNYGSTGTGKSMFGSNK